MSLTAAAPPSVNPPARRTVPPMTDRPPYDPTFVATARTLAARGAVDHDIAVALGVELRTVVEWQALHPAFGEACAVPRAAADAAVEAALYRLATGYSYDDQKVFVLREGQVMKLPYVGHVPPDDQAIIWWLTHRRPDEWRDLRPPRAPRDKQAREAAAPPPADEPPARCEPVAPAACTAVAPAASADVPMSADQASARLTRPQGYASHPVAPVDDDTGLPCQVTMRLPPDVDPRHFTRALADAFARTGGVDHQLATTFHIGASDLQAWKLRDPAFAAAAMPSADEADAAVVHALLLKATGYRWQQEDIHWKEDHPVVRVMRDRHLPPSRRAATFWLANRMPERWSAPPPQGGARVGNGDAGLTETAQAGSAPSARRSAMASVVEQTAGSAETLSANIAPPPSVEPRTDFSVVPAKAGTHVSIHMECQRNLIKPWAPACAGATESRVNSPISAAYGVAQPCGLRSTLKNAPSPLVGEGREGCGRSGSMPLRPLRPLMCAMPDVASLFSARARRSAHAGMRACRLCPPPAGGRPRARSHPLLCGHARPPPPRSARRHPLENARRPRSRPI